MKVIQIITPTHIIKSETPILSAEAMRKLFGGWWKSEVINDSDDIMLTAINQIGLLYNERASRVAGRDIYGIAYITPNGMYK